VPSIDWRAFAKDEWLLLLALTGLIGTSLALWRIPNYALSDAEILYILLILFIVIRGLQTHGAIAAMSSRLERGRSVGLKLVVGAFFISMLVTNDVTLIALTPLTLLLHFERLEWLIILEILAANAGSALSPFGNPQNLFIYWFYNVPFTTFVATIAPFSLVFLVLLMAGAWLIDMLEGPRTPPAPTITPVAGKRAYLYAAMLVLVVLVVVRVVPLYAGGIVILFAILFDRGSLRVDYALLATFACFFGFTDNLQVVFSNALAHSHHVFLLAALLSQVISNVPTALLLADFTDRWQALLWGVSVGGFGTLVASLANLIGYRIYVREVPERSLGFTARFHLISFTALFIGIGLYVLLFIVP
jgi:Na+/H+ antiporter NhaD/arsenite permease-like protein